MRATIWNQPHSEILFPSPQPSPAGSSFDLERLLAGEGARDRKDELTRQDVLRL
jgi:hypothetical protein